MTRRSYPTPGRARPGRRLAAVGAVAVLAASIAQLPASTVTASARGGVTAVARGQAGAPTCAVPGDCRLAEAGRAVGVRIGLASSNGSLQHRATLLAEADLVVNHELSWSGIEPERGVWDFTKADENDAFAEDNDLEQLAMHFAWDQAIVDDLPAWVLGITDPDELRAVLAERARVIFERYPGIDRIDVINEPFQTLGHELYANHFHAVLGPDYIDELFTIVEAHAPADVELIVNEAGIEFQPRKADALVALVADLVAAGHRVDAVGLQTHLAVGEPDWDLLLATMQRLEALGVRPFISEVDVPVPASLPDRFAVQAERYRRVVLTCLAVPSCDTINVWGVSDADTWYDNVGFPGMDPLLFDDRFAPKPAYHAVRDALLAGRIDPAQLPGTAAAPVDGGDVEVMWSMACRPTAPLRPRGIALISEVVDLFLSGNPIRLQVPARLRWTPSTDPEGTITYQVEAALDLSTTAARYRDETARPAIGMGGYPDLVDTVWITLEATDIALTIPHPAGAVPGGPTTSGPDTTTVVSGTGATLSRRSAHGDTRAPGAAATLVGGWTVEAGGGSEHVTGMPRLRFDLTARLGVLTAGRSVFGAVDGTFVCEPTDAVAVARTTTEPVPPAADATPIPAPSPAASMAPATAPAPAVAIVTTARLTG